MDRGFTDVQVSWTAYWECGTCGEHGEAGPFEEPEFEPEDAGHECAVGE